MLTHLPRLARGALTLTLAGGIAMLVTVSAAAPAFAVYPVLTTTLTGPVMQGSVIILSNPTRWAAGNC